MSPVQSLMFKVHRAIREADYMLRDGVDLIYVDVTITREELQKVMTYLAHIAEINDLKSLEDAWYYAIKHPE